MSSEENTNVQVIPANKEKIMHIWKVAGILTVLTAIEFIIAFGMDAGLTRTWIFIAMTIVKAFYIVGEFMHLKHEAKTLIWSILIPTIFIVWLVIALIYEGGAIFEARGW
jgi:cytochrome c oxidase subunit IV